jgi:hypothetical protein
LLAELNGEPLEKALQEVNLTPYIVRMLQRTFPAAVYIFAAAVVFLLVEVLLVRGLGFTPMSERSRITIYGPKTDGTYVVEFRTADGEALEISVPAGESRVLKHFQERMPYVSIKP